MLFLARHGRIYSECVSGLGRELIGIDQGDISKYGSEAGWVLGCCRVVLEGEICLFWLRLW